MNEGFRVIGPARALHRGLVVVGLALAIPVALAQVAPPPAAPAPSRPPAANGGLSAWMATPAGGAIPAQPVPPPSAAIAPALPPLPTVAQSRAAAFQRTQAEALTPAEILSLRRMLMARQAAAAALPNPPKPVTGTVQVSLTPGATPPVIRIYQGMVSTLSVVDATGAPWPVTNIVAGNPALFTVARLDGPEGSVLALTPMAAFGDSNLVLMLAGNPSPVMLTIVAGQKDVDERTEVRVDAAGPEARMVATRLPPGVDTRLLGVLDGVPPTGARALGITGADHVQAWLLPDRRMVVRTRAMLVGLPIAGVEATSSAGGTYVYELPATPRLAMLDHNRFVTLHIEGL